MEKPIFEFIIDESGEHFTTAIVKNPAVEKTLMYFDEEKPAYFVNEEKRLIYSVAMQPNKLIFRKATNEIPEHYGFFSKESIEKFQENYEKFNGNQKVNIDHTQNKVEGVFRVENWIVNDAEIDKTKTLGIDCENGSLIMGFKIENNEVWEQCKNGNLDGLSIEAHLLRKETNNFKTEINMNKLEKVTKFFTELFADEVQETEEEKTARIAKEEADKLADEPTPPSEELTKLTQENEMLKAKIAELEKTIADAEVKEVKDETALATMKSEVEKMRADFELFKSQTPASAPVKDAPKEVLKSFAEMTPIEKFRAQKNN
jgi:hypothetical protein